MPAACEISALTYEWAFVSVADHEVEALGRGLVLGVEPMQDRETKALATDAAEAVFYRALEAGLSFKVTMGNVLTLTPPLVISEGDLMRGLDILEGCIGEVG